MNAIKRIAVGLLVLALFSAVLLGVGLVLINLSKILENLTGMGYVLHSIFGASMIALVCYMIGGELMEQRDDEEEGEGVRVIECDRDEIIERLKQGEIKFASYSLGHLHERIGLALKGDEVIFVPGNIEISYPLAFYGINNNRWFVK